MRGMFLAGGIWQPNTVVLTGVNDLLDVGFGSTAKRTWYIGLMTGTVEVSHLDTLVSHAGWTESTKVGGRQEVSWMSASNGRIRSDPVEFTLTDDETITGIFLCSASSGTSGILWSAAAITPIAKLDTETFRSAYVVRM